MLHLTFIVTTISGIDATPYLCDIQFQIVLILSKLAIILEPQLQQHMEVLSVLSHVKSDT